MIRVLIITANRLLPYKTVGKCKLFWKLVFLSRSAIVGFIQQGFHSNPLLEYMYGHQNQKE